MGCGGFSLTKGENFHMLRESRFFLVYHSRRRSAIPKGGFFMAESETPWKKLTIEQIAPALGVSKTTVSRALSGKGGIG